MFLKIRLRVVEVGQVSRLLFPEVLARFFKRVLKYSGFMLGALILERE